MEDHKIWSGGVEWTQGHAVNFPIVGGEVRKVSRLYEMPPPGDDDSSTVRLVFMTDLNKKIWMILAYPMCGMYLFRRDLHCFD